MKRLVFTVTNDLTYDQRMQRICRTLAAAGFEVLLIGFLKAQSQPLVEEPYQQKRLRLLFRKGKLFYLEYNIRLFFKLLFQPADAFCCIDLDTLTAGFLATRLRPSIQLVHDAHEYFSELPEVVGRRTVSWFWSKLEGWLLPRIKHNYTVSASIAAELERKYSRSYEVFPNYPVLEETEVPTEGQAGLLLYQGALNQGRGLEASIVAMASIDGRLWIAGEGDLSEDLRAYAAKHVSAERVDFLGYLPPEALRDHTRRAWLGLNLLEHRGLSYYYSLSNKFFDYMHAGLPQIAMDYPEYRRINETYEVAVLIPEARPEALIEAVSSLQRDPLRYERLKRNCLAARQHYHWKNLAPDLVAFYRHLS